MMYISKMTLFNYRNFKNSNFIFNKNVNTIIGENGSGKINLFRAIRLLLDDNILKYAYKLYNLSQMSNEKRFAATKKLENILNKRDNL